MGERFGIGSFEKIAFYHGDKLLFTSSFDQEQTVLEVKKVIFNPPATIVFWKDGSKTTVKTNDEIFCEEKGFAMAFLKKVYGGRLPYMKHIRNAQRPQLSKIEI